MQIRMLNLPKHNTILTTLILIYKHVNVINEF